MHSISMSSAYPSLEFFRTGASRAYWCLSHDPLRGLPPLLFDEVTSCHSEPVDAGRGGFPDPSIVLSVASLVARLRCTIASLIRRSQSGSSRCRLAPFGRRELRKGDGSLGKRLGDRPGGKNQRPTKTTRNPAKSRLALPASALRLTQRAQDQDQALAISCGNRPHRAGRWLKAGWT
jgi:hypothetical protein